MQKRRVHRRTPVQRRIELRLLDEGHATRSKRMRRGPRSEANVTASSTVIPGALIDIGCGGMCAAVGRSLEIGQVVEIHIHDTEGGIQRARGEVRTTLPRATETFHGFSFDEPMLTLGDTARCGPNVVHDHTMKPLVLVVDDEPSVRSVLDRFLTERGLRVFPAVDADEALEAIKHERPSLMILDLRMPKVGGLELLELLQRAGIKVPTIWAMSGYVSDEDARRALQLGASEFFNKPFDLDHIDYTLSLLAPML